jgi:hypothetical protein
VHRIFVRHRFIGKNANPSLHAGWAHGDELCRSTPILGIDVAPTAARRRRFEFLEAVVGARSDRWNRLANAQLGALDARIAFTQRMRQEIGFEHSPRFGRWATAGFAARAFGGTEEFTE